MKPIKPLVENRDVAVVDVATSVAQAARIMSEREVGAASVVEGDRVAGIFTERDIEDVLLVQRMSSAVMRPTRGGVLRRLPSHDDDAERSRHGQLIRLIGVASTCRAEFMNFQEDRYPAGFTALPASAGLENRDPVQLVGACRTPAADPTELRPATPVIA